MQNNICLKRYGSNLTKRQVQDAENDLPVMMLSSTYSADEHRIRDAILPGMKILTFAQLLKYSRYPMTRILSELLQVGRKGMGCEIEIEFAVNLQPEIEKSTFYFLQIRPMVTGGERADVQISDQEVKRAFCYSKNALGHGNFDEIADIVYVHPDDFDPSKTQAIAAEIGAVNRKLEREGRLFLLIGQGRWGSADPWLGIPVQWSNISGVGAIIELRGGSLRVDPSQGSHFFQNITSLGIPYLTVTEEEQGKAALSREAEFFDWNWLIAQPHPEQYRFVRHVRLASPLLLKCDGKKTESCILSPAGAEAPDGS
jgi:hypothetical protein